MKTEIEKLVLIGTASVKQSIKLMDDAGEGLLIILDESHRIKGLITDGDVRKGILKGVSLESPVEDILNTNPFVCKDDIPRPEIKKRLTELQRHCMPIVDDNNILVDVMFLKECETPKPEKKSNKVILMAGGKGSRLDPFTKILPKALIPLNDKPIIEMIMNNFQECGFQKFMISINHKADMIKNYFNHSTNNHDFEFVEETKRLGTVGALSLMRDKLTETFFVCNCDTIIRADYEKILKHHKNNNAALTIVSSMQEIKVPFGILSIDDSGALSDIKEKPEFNYLVNTGMYVIDPRALKYIPDNAMFDITHLIQRLKENNEKIVTYPISKNNWFDTGQWEEYQRTVNEFKKFK